MSFCWPIFIARVPKRDDFSPNVVYATCCIYAIARTVFVMSRTFGGKTKDTNEAMYDHYPLKECTLHSVFFRALEPSETSNSHFAIVVQ